MRTTLVVISLLLALVVPAVAGAASGSAPPPRENLSGRISAKQVRHQAGKYASVLRYRGASVKTPCLRLRKSAVNCRINATFPDGRFESWVVKGRAAIYQDGHTAFWFKRVKVGAAGQPAPPKLGPVLT